MARKRKNIFTGVRRSILDMLLHHTDGTATEKLALLRRLKAEGKLAAEDAGQVAATEELLVTMELKGR